MLVTLLIVNKLYRSLKEAGYSTIRNGWLLNKFNVIGDRNVIVVVEAATDGILVNEEKFTSNNPEMEELVTKEVLTLLGKVKNKTKFSIKDYIEDFNK